MTRPLMKTLGLTAVACMAMPTILLLSGSTGAASKGSRLSEATLELVPVVSKGLQSPLFLTRAVDAQ